MAPNAARPWAWEIPGQSVQQQQQAAFENMWRQLMRELRVSVNTQNSEGLSMRWAEVRMP
jgi:hypothetical protein